MSQQTQATGSGSPADAPMKRKRGRPRKDENLVHAEKAPVTPGSDILMKNKQNVTTNNAAATSDDDPMVGQVVFGVVDGIFDGGYLLNVKVGDTDTQLRGVVFLPGRFIPVTPANDVAPNATMIKRKEIPFPAKNSLGQLHGGSVPPPEQSDKQPVERQNQAPEFLVQAPSSELQSGNLIVGPDKSASAMISQADNTLQGEKVLSAENLESGQEKSKTPSSMVQVENTDGKKPESEAFGLVKEPGIVLGFPDSSNPICAQLVDITPSPETEPELQVKNSNLEQNQTPISAQLVTISCEPTKTMFLQEKQVSLEIDAEKPGLGNKIVNGDEEPGLNGTPKSEAVKSSEGEVVWPEAKLADEGLVLPPKVAKPDTHDSTGAAGDVDCDMVDANPPPPQS